MIAEVFSAEVIAEVFTFQARHISAARAKLASYLWGYLTIRVSHPAVVGVEQPGDC